MSTPTAPDYEQFSADSVGPDGLGIDHYAKHELWVRWLTAYAEAERLSEEYIKLHEKLRGFLRDYDLEGRRAT